MSVTAHWEGGYRCRVAVRQFELRADEPPQDGGDDTGPRPTELLLASVAACFAMALSYVARKRGMELPDDLAVTTSGEYSGPRFRALRTEVSGSLPRAEMERLVKQAVGYCWVSNTVRGNPNLEFVVADPG
jgi:organic hydroperoxide reductase OsmC/OhrA